MLFPTFCGAILLIQVQPAIANGYPNGVSIRGPQILAGYTLTDPVLPNLYHKRQCSVSCSGSTFVTPIETSYFMANYSFFSGNCCTGTDTAGCCGRSCCPPNSACCEDNCVDPTDSCCPDGVTFCAQGSVCCYLEEYEQYVCSVTGCQNAS